MTDTLTRQMPRRRVRVWFGSTAIADQTFAADLAARYEQGMRVRFAGLKITNEPVGDVPATP